MEYNTTRNNLSMREYGRHIQKMVEYVLSIKDPVKRNQQAKAVIELMGFLNPHLKNVEDFRHMLWDHLFFMSDFKLDVESPYPIPQKETYKGKPEPLTYPSRHPKYPHLGRNIQSVIDKAIAEESPEKKEGFAHSIAYYMKLAYNNWHKEQVHDDAICLELDAITDGKLSYSADTPLVKHTRMLGIEREEVNGNRSVPVRRSSYQTSGRDNNTGSRRNNSNNNNNNRDNNRHSNNNNNTRGTNRNFKRHY